MPTYSPNLSIYPPIQNPYRRALVVLTTLAALFLFVTLVAAGLNWIQWIGVSLVWISGIFFAFWLFIDLIIWLMGAIKLRQARSFLASDRPLVRWVYSYDEWYQFRESMWQEEHADWKVQFGCLSALFGLIGLLTGAMIGFEKDLATMMGDALIGLFAGLMIGAVLGAVVAGANHLSARLAHAQRTPGQVALAHDELFFVDQYFQANGDLSQICGAELEQGDPAILTIQLLFPPRPRREREEEWLIPVPRKWIETVEEILPYLVRAGSNEKSRRHFSG